MDINHIEDNSLDINPSLGSTVSFSSLVDSVAFGDSHSQRMPKGINSLNMKMSLTFDEITDGEAQTLISFFQESFFYETQTWNANGIFTNKRIAPFTYQPFFPYRSNNFYCFNFTHEKTFQNVNKVTAVLNAASAAITSSVDINTIFNNLVQCQHDLAFPIPNQPNNGIIVNRSPAQDNINMVVKGPTIARNIFYRPNSYVTYEGVSTNPNRAFLASNNTVNLDFSSTSNVERNAFVDGVCSSTPRRNSIYIDRPDDCDFYPYAPRFGRGNQTDTMDIRMFDFRPNSTLSINHSPKYRSSKVVDFYDKFNKYGFNPNLSNITVDFTARSDFEAKSILVFLEAHLGYKKFGFHVHRDYQSLVDDDNNRSPHRRSYKTFYCPEWTHRFVYQNNHTISATFIECLDY